MLYNEDNVAKYDFLKQLITLAEEYEGKAADSENPPAIKDFSLWLFAMHGKEQEPDARFGNAEYERHHGRDKIETHIGRLIVYMYRYARIYTRKALEGTELQTADEFSYLATLLTHNSLKKSELIAKNIHEKPTGMEIIKRLIGRGLIDQYDDDHDKRSKLLKINSKGKATLYSVFDKMSRVSDIIGGELDMEEKMQLLFLLKKLDTHHHDIFMNKKEEVLDSI